MRLAESASLSLGVGVGGIFHIVLHKREGGGPEKVWQLEDAEVGERSI